MKPCSLWVHGLQILIIIFLAHGALNVVFFNLNVPLNYLMCPVFTVGPLPETVVEAVEKVAAPFFKFFFPLEQNW